MKKTLSFEKDLALKTKIGEVTTIDFEEDLKFTDKNNIDGNFYISGKYKMHEASTIEETFSFSVPITISLLENYELESTKISIDNFTYEIIDDSILRAKINVLIEGREEVLLDEDKNDERECDDDNIPEDLKEIPTKEQKEDKKEEKQPLKTEKDTEKDIVKQEDIRTDEDKKEEKEEPEFIEKEEKVVKVNSLFSNLGDELDTFTTYSVYIMREGDTLENVMNKYKVTKEDLETYNDLSTLELNSKVIIPTNNE